MTKRKKKKQKSLQPVASKSERLEFAETKVDEESITDEWGARIFTDVTKHSFLDIPHVNPKQRDGDIYEVLSVRVTSAGVLAIVKRENEPVAYRLPDDYTGWAQQIIHYAQEGIDLLPDTIEFGYDVIQNRYYAKIRILHS
ncbi:hypothetical protein DNHGIG_21560 [Collibacillus ludicampi]|jgi:hypothetical protein|uniref:Uncharacterized protein n=1 Tax=Collibacillus ludicampi TaxID=2771369 RepID=A0AAV4LFM6_9BACL|nr:hypothetical protein [Collibacillus ludicampi]GIM46607.1 hypothetical protein DNHGIG_21560 [Collibacillus ludicampi]